MAATAARSFIRSARTGATRFAAGTKPKSAPLPFRATTAKQPSSRISRMPVEMSFAMESMLPFHSATASSLLNSMLSVTPRIYGWTIEGSISRPHEREEGLGTGGPKATAKYCKY